MPQSAASPAKSNGTADSCVTELNGHLYAPITAASLRLLFQEQQRYASFRNRKSLPVSRLSEAHFVSDCSLLVFSSIQILRQFSQRNCTKAFPAITVYASWITVCRSVALTSKTTNSHSASANSLITFLTGSTYSWCSSSVR